LVAKPERGTSALAALPSTEQNALREGQLALPPDREFGQRRLLRDGLGRARAAPRHALPRTGHLQPEIREPDSGAVLPVETGVGGELACISLDRECVPLVRLRTRDHIVDPIGST
jgi:hypothetical protein